MLPRGGLPRRELLSRETEESQVSKKGTSATLLGIYLKNLKTFICEDVCTPMFTASLFTVAKTGKQPQCPSVDDWIKTAQYIHAVDYYSAIRV